MKSSSAFLILTGACAFCSCTTWTPSPVTNAKQTPKAESAAAPAATPSAAPVASLSADSYRKTLMAADLEFSRACEEKGAAESFYEYLAPDGVCLLAGDNPIEGRDAVKVHFSASPGEALSWKPRLAEVSLCTDLGYTWGTYESKISSQDNAAASITGKYAIVWKRQADGTWKAVLFVTSAGAAAGKKA